MVAYLIAVLEKSHIHWSKLESMFVQEALRRSGIGTGLTHHFLDWSRQQGAAKVTVAVAAANEAALNLYRKVGFIEVDRRGKTVILAIPKAELSC